MSKFSNSFILIIFAAMASGCAHTVAFRANHFASPIVGQKQWNPRLALAYTGHTSVTLVSNTNQTPVTNNTIEVDKQQDVEDLLLVNSLALDAGINVWKSVEVFSEGTWLGVKHQFLNHGSNTKNWVASVQAGFNSRTESSNRSDSGLQSSAESDIFSSQVGLSVGYDFGDRKLVPYFSYIYEKHDVSTKGSNASGSFGPFKDSASHRNYAIGLMTRIKGFRGAVEYAIVATNWPRAENTTRGYVGLQLGFELDDSPKTVSPPPQGEE